MEHPSDDLEQRLRVLLWNASKLARIDLLGQRELIRGIEWRPISALQSNCQAMSE